MQENAKKHDTKTQPPSQALISIFMQVPNWDISLANTTESLAQNICKQHSRRGVWSHSVKTKSLAKSDSEHEIVRSYYYMICMLFFQLLPDHFSAKFKFIR